MNKLLLALVALSCWGHSAKAQKTDKKLTLLIENAIAPFQGDIGIYVYHAKQHKQVAIHADTIFPTASLVKLPILVGVFQKIKQGELRLDQPFSYPKSRQYGGSGLMQHYHDSAKTDLATMVSLMLTYSDNVTSIWNQELAGGGQAINPLLQELGLHATRVNSRTKGREEQWKDYGWGQTTAKEMAQLLLLIRQGKVLDSYSSETMYRYLKNQFYNERSLSQIPATTATASKTGSLNAARGEVVYVHAPQGEYVFCILTKNNKDQSWTSSNEAEVLTRQLSSLLWNYYNPKHPYTAPTAP